MRYAPAGYIWGTTNNGYKLHIVVPGAPKALCRASFRTEMETALGISTRVCRACAVSYVVTHSEEE